MPPFPTAKIAGLYQQIVGFFKGGGGFKGGVQLGNFKDS